MASSATWYKGGSAPVNYVHYRVYQIDTLRPYGNTCTAILVQVHDGSMCKLVESAYKEITLSIS